MKSIRRFANTISTNMDGKFSLKRKCTHWHTLSSTHTRAQTRLFIPSLSLSQTVPLFHTHARTHAHARCSAAVEWTHLSIHPAQSKRWVREREREREWESRDFQELMSYRSTIGGGERRRPNETRHKKDTWTRQGERARERKREIERGRVMASLRTAACCFFMCCPLLPFYFFQFSSFREKIPRPNILLPNNNELVILSFYATALTKYFPDQ